MGFSGPLRARVPLRLVTTYEALGMSSGLLLWATFWLAFGVLFGVDILMNLSDIV
jgi:hypothetical protein